MEVAILTLKRLFFELKRNLLEVHNFFNQCTSFGEHFGLDFLLL